MDIPVFATNVADSAETPRTIEWPMIAAPEMPEIDSEARFVLDAVSDPVRGTIWRINGEEHPRDPLFTWRQGETVRITIVNNLGPEHPFHLHGQFFQVLLGGSVPGPQTGLKDTVLVPGVETVQILATMDNPGRWMVHCHILEHAHLGMMGEVVVEPTATE